MARSKRRKTKRPVTILGPCLLDRTRDQERFTKNPQEGGHQVEWSALRRSGYVRRRPKGHGRPCGANTVHSRCRRRRRGPRPRSQRSQVLGSEARSDPGSWIFGSLEIPRAVGPMMIHGRGWDRWRHAYARRERVCVIRAAGNERIGKSQRASPANGRGGRLVDECE